MLDFNFHELLIRFVVPQIVFISTRDLNFNLIPEECISYTPILARRVITRVAQDL